MLFRAAILKLLSSSNASYGATTLANVQDQEASKIFELSMQVVVPMCLAFLQDQQFSEIPVLTAKFDRQLAEVGARLQALRELQPTSVRCQALAQTDIPQLRQRVQELEAAAEQGGEALDTASSDSMEAQHAYQVSPCPYFKLVSHAKSSSLQCPRRDGAPQLTSLFSQEHDALGLAQQAVSCSLRNTK